MTALNRVDLPTLGRPTIPACNIGRTDSGSRSESQIPIAAGYLRRGSQSPFEQIFRFRPDAGRMAAEDDDDDVAAVEAGGGHQAADDR